MKKIFLIIMVSFFSIINTFADDYKCTSHDLYNVPVFEMTNGNDKYSCDDGYWMQGNIIKTLGGNDEVSISRNTGSDKLDIYMGDGDDTFFHTYHDVQLVGAMIDGGAGNDTIKISGANKDDFIITGDCSNSCVIEHKIRAYLFKDVKLVSIENVIFDDETVSSDNNSSSNNQVVEENNNNNQTQNTSNNFGEQYKFNNLFFYYGYPTHLGDASKYYNSDKIIQDNTRVEMVSPLFAKFQAVVWAGALASNSHEEHNNTTKIIKNIKSTTTSYGYVAMYGDDNLSNSIKICDNVDKWFSMGVDGIFYDEAGFDYFEQKNSNYEDYKILLKNIYKCAKDENLKVIFNSWSASDIINNLTLDSNDGVLIESFYYGNGVNKQGYIDNVERYKALKNKTKAQYFCVATTQKGASQTEVNRVGKEIKDEMIAVCEYRSVQDHYGSSSSVKFATDDILNGNENIVNYRENNNISNNTTQNNNVVSNDLSQAEKDILTKYDKKIDDLFLKIKNKNTNKNYKKIMKGLISKIEIIKNSGKYDDNILLTLILDLIMNKAEMELGL